MRFIALASNATSRTGSDTKYPPAVCQEGNCSPEVLSISLEGLLKSSPTPQRTVKYQSAYLKAKDIKRGQGKDPTWEGRYLANELKGKVACDSII